LPNVIVAVAIFVVAIVVADVLEKLIKASVKKMEVGYAGFFGALVKGAVYTFATLAILLQLGVTPQIVNALIFGLIGTISLALGLAFGLGGKDAAAEFIEEIRKKISEK
jgi:small-conductance mechanosensitive channel